MNWDITGHEWAVKMLRSHLEENALRHAYLITGPQGVGRRTLALRFIQAINCSQPPAPGEPCLTCKNCTQIGRMQHVDLNVLGTDATGRDIKIDQVRNMQHMLALSPYQARYRVALLVNFEGATPSAQNAMLKTLEEAPTRVVLILTASASESVLPTIASRCETIRLRPLSIELLEQELIEKKKLTPDEADRIAHLSGGKIGVAYRMLEDPKSFEAPLSFLADIPGLLSSSRRARFDYVARLVDIKDRDKAHENTTNLLLAWESFWRDVLLAASGAGTPLTNLEHRDAIQRIANHVDIQQARQIITATREGMEKNLNARLMLEVLLLDWPHLR